MHYDVTVQEGDNRMTNENKVPVSQDSNVSLADVRRALEDPDIRKSAPNELIGNLINAMGLEDIPCIDTEEAERIRKIYFQATRLEKDRWTTMPGIENTVQIIPYKIKGDLPEGTHLVVDVLIDKSDYEAECFEKYVKNMMVRGNNIIFFAVAPLPCDIVIGIKCADENDEPVYIPDEMIRKGE